MITYESAKKLEKVIPKPELGSNQAWYNERGTIYHTLAKDYTDKTVTVVPGFTYAPSVGDLLKLLPHYQLRWNPKENVFDCSANIWGIPMSSSSHVIAEEAVALEIFKVYKITI